MGCFTLTPSLGVTPANILINFTSSENRGTVLSDAENLTIVSSFVWTKHRNVTDGRTGRQAEVVWLLQRSALQTMRTRCKNCTKLFFE